MTTQRRPTLCIVAGPNGSGKTSTTQLLLQNEWTAEAVKAFALSGLQFAMNHYNGKG